MLASLLAGYFFGVGHCRMETAARVDAAELSAFDAAEFDRELGAWLEDLPIPCTSR